jgi:hypothetical protein
VVGRTADFLAILYWDVPYFLFREMKKHKQVYSINKFMQQKESNTGDIYGLFLLMV